MKVINILTHIPGSVIQDYKDPIEFKKRFSDIEYVTIDKNPYWVAFFKNDWHHKWGEYFKKQDPKLEIECWRPYGDIIDQSYSKNVDGILHRVFPSRTYKIKKVGSLLISNLLIKELKKEINNNKVIIHFYGSHDLFISWLLLKLKPKNTPIILQHLGGCFKYFYFKFFNNPLSLIPYYFEKKALKYVDKYLTASIVEKKFIAEKFPKLDTKFILNGIDFSKIKAEDRKITREKLGLKIKDKVILYVGRYYETKNVDKLIASYISLKKEDKNIKLFLVGGYKSDPFYQMAIDSGANVIERTDESIIKYFTIADVYVVNATDRITKNFGGIGIAPLESLACNVPVISDNLVHIECDDNELKKLGLQINNNLKDSIKYVLNNKEQFKECRKVVKKHFNIEDNTQKIINIYKSLSQ